MNENQNSEITNLSGLMTGFSHRERLKALKDISPEEKRRIENNAKAELRENNEEIRKKIQTLSEESKTENIRDVYFDIIDEQLSNLETEQHLKQVSKQTKLALKTIREDYQKILKQDKQARKQKKKLTSEEIKLVEDKLRSPLLIKEVWKELDRNHKEDHFEKLAVFLVRVTSELNSKERQSVAIKGNSSAGKDNIIKSVFKLFPQEEQLFLTRGTQASIEEEIKKVKALAFSEMNVNREEGANKELTEIFKQVVEGGVSVLKKDKNTNENIRIQADQISGFYGTTEAKSDEELETRYVIIPVKSDRGKNFVVVNDYLQTESDLELLNQKSQESWLVNAFRVLSAKKYEVYIPYANYLSRDFEYEGKKQKLFDLSKDRVKRDVKRLLSITKAVTLLYSYQRDKREYEDKTYVVSKPQDFWLAFKITYQFFADTYEGLDFRQQQVLQTIKEQEGKQDDLILSNGYARDYLGWVFRHKVQELCGIESVNTIKSYVDELKDKLKVNVFYDNSKPRGYLLKSVGYQEGINRVSEGIKLIGIDTLLTPYLTGQNSQESKNGDTDKTNPRREYELFKREVGLFFSELTPSELTPSISGERQPSLSCEKQRLIQNKKHILDFLREENKPVAFEEILKACDDSFTNETLEAMLKEHKEKGDIYEPKPDYWGVV